MTECEYTKQELKCATNMNAHLIYCASLTSNAMCKYFNFTVMKGNIENVARMSNTHYFDDIF